MQFDKSKLLKGDAIKVGIKKFATSMQGVDEQVHLLACSAITHAAETGDSTYCTDLVETMPKSSRGQSLKDWIIKSTGCLMWQTTEGSAKFKKVGGKEYNMETVVAAYEHPFYEKEEVTAKPFDLARLLKMLDAVSKRTTKGIQKGTLKVDVAALTEIKGKLASFVREVTPVAVSNQSIIDTAMQKQQSEAA